MNVLSLFDGMSCGQIALQRTKLNVQCYLSSEIDKPAINITMKNYPNTVQLGDVNGYMNWTLPTIDLLMGGSPCQGFSFAGKMLGLDDPRSALFHKFMASLERFRPRYFLLENVVMRSSDRDYISDALGVEPITINSSLVSAQNRNRLYWTNIPVPVGISPADKGLFWKDAYARDDMDAFYYNSSSFNWIFGTQYRRNKYYEYQPDDTVKMQIVEASHYKGYSNQRCFGIRDVRGVRYISPTECERLQTVPDGYTAGVSRTQRYKMLGNGWTVDVIAWILSHIKE